MTYANRDLLDKPNKRRYRDVYLPVKDVTVRIRSLMESEYASFATKVLNRSKSSTGEIAKARRQLIALCLVDGEGNLLYSQQESELLKDWDTADVGELQDAINAHLKLADTDVEDMLKN